MKKEEFFTEFKKALQRNEAIDDSTLLENLDEWDSLGIISVVSLLNQKYNVATDYATLSKCVCVKDIRQKVVTDE